MMMNRQDYVYCPFCGTELIVRMLFARRRATCPACGFVQFRDPKVAVIGLVTWHERVLLIRRGVDPARGKWALPGGYMDAGEMPEDALARELAEEVGLQVSIRNLLRIFPMAGPDHVARGIVLAYQAIPVTATLPALCCEDDASEAGWFTVQQLPADLAFESTHTLLADWKEAKSHE